MTSQRRTAWTLPFITLLTFALGAPIAHAADSKSSRQPARQKVIDFEDEIVEGMNKRPLDSLSQISERDRRKHKPHLYRKRVGFRAETVQTVHELRYIE